MPTARTTTCGRSCATTARSCRSSDATAAWPVTSVSSVAGKGVTTLEGLGALGRLHPVQQAFVDEQAAQCGYCVSGMIMTTAALLKKTARPTAAQIRTALAGNLCRCGTHMRILRAVRRAARA